MIHISVIGDAPDDVLEIFPAEPVEHEEEADLALAWYDDPVCGSKVRHRERKDIVLIALITDEEDRTLAQNDGATEVLLWPRDREQLVQRARLIGRVNATWARRLKTQERRARRAMTELASTQDLLGRLIDATPNPVIAADIQGRVLVFNRAAERSLGYEASWARDHMHVTDVYADPTQPRRVLAQIRNSAAGIVHDIAIRLRDRSGEHIPVLLSAAEVYSADGMPMATVGVFQDQRLENSLRDRLKQTTVQLIDSEKQRAAMELAGAAAHEINQPLTAVMGSLEMLSMRSDLPGDVTQRLDRAYGQLERVAEIVRSLHSRTGRGTIEYVTGTQITDLSRTKD